MDPELIAYLDRFDRNFAELRQETASIREEIASFRQDTEGRFDKVEAEVRQSQVMIEQSQVMIEQNQVMIGQNRMMIEDLYSKVQTVAEGVVNNSEVIERFRGEMKKELADVRSEMRSQGRQINSVDVRMTALEKARLGH